MTPAEEVEGLAAALIIELRELEEMVPEPAADPTRGTMSHHKISGSPAPWHPEAGPLVMTIHAGVRDVEVDLKYAVSERIPAGRHERGGSDGNTKAALAAIVRLAYGAPEEAVKRAAGDLADWVLQSKRVRGESERWIPIHVPRGQLPPECPYCRTFMLRVAEESGRVACAKPRCTDENGKRPTGRIDRNRLTGDAMIAWVDGRTSYYQDAERDHDYEATVTDNQSPDYHG